MVAPPPRRGVHMDSRRHDDPWLGLRPGAAGASPALAMPRSLVHPTPRRSALRPVFRPIPVLGLPLCLLSCAFGVEQSEATNVPSEPGGSGGADGGGVDGGQDASADTSTAGWPGGGSAGAPGAGGDAGQGGSAGSETGGSAGAGGCVPGDEEILDQCDKCGTLRRVCDTNGQWLAAECVSQGACSPGETTSEPCGNCGSRTLTCSASCSWEPGACTGGGVCSPGATSSEPCGNCGTRPLTCSAACAWESGACGGEGPCSPGQTRDCMCSTYGGTTACCGQEVCGNDCQWGGCALKPGNTCDWQAGSHFRCCASGSWQFCLPSCKWSTACASCSGCGC